MSLQYLTFILLVGTTGDTRGERKVEVMQITGKKNQRLGLEREKGDRGANRYGSLPIMGGLGLQHLACSIQNRILLPYTGV